MQEDIQLQLGQAETVISEAIKILEKKYGKTAPTSRSTSLYVRRPTTKTYFSSSTNSWLSASTSPIQLISWSMKGKKRVENVVRNFSDLNEQIQEKIKLCS
jgi:hypothetical protein